MTRLVNAVNFWSEAYITTDTHRSNFLIISWLPGLMYWKWRINIWKYIRSVIYYETKEILMYIVVYIVAILLLSFDNNSMT